MCTSHKIDGRGRCLSKILFRRADATQKRNNRYDLKFLVTPTGVRLSWSEDKNVKGN